MTVDSRVSRRAVLHTVGVAAVSGLAGCGSLTDGPDPAPQTGTQSATATTGGAPVEMEQVVSEHIDAAAGVGGRLTYSTAGGSQRVVHGGVDGPVFEDVAGSYVAVDDGVAYTATDRQDGAGSWVIVSGTEELYRNTVDLESGSAPPEATGELFDALDGDALWTEPAAARWPSTLRRGSEPIDHGYDGVRDVRAIGGEAAFVGLTRVADDSTRYPSGWRYDRIVAGGTTVQELGPELGYDGDMVGVDGSPAIVLVERDGAFVRYRGDSFGRQYTTTPGDGEIQWIGSVGGRLAFVARVARDRQEHQSWPREYALWYGGEEVDRHQNVDPPILTDEGLTYRFSDEDESGIRVGDDVRSVAYSYDHTSIDGTLAYATGGADEEIVVYGGQEIVRYPNIEQIFEVDADLAYLVETDPNAPRSTAIYREV